jgi:hypothetical protein
MPTNDTTYTESPSAWFAALERAIRTGNLPLARRCESELRRLGIEVTIYPSAMIGFTTTPPETNA